jgi:alcohol dehydrogenase
MTDLLHPIEIVRPETIEFGSGTIAVLSQWAKAQKRTLVIADAFNAERVKVLGLQGDVILFGEVKPEPDIPNLEKALAVAERVKPNLVVGFGGGSAMDLAKLVSVLAGSGQAIHDVVGAERTKGRACAIVQVPTTSGTGSEAGTRALVTDPVTRNKLAVQRRHMLADLAVVDPDLTATVPPHVTAATGVDALAHCVEASPMLADPSRSSIAPKLLPIGRYIKVEEVAATVCFLLSPDAAAITGQQLVICGGSSL